MLYVAEPLATRLSESDAEGRCYARRLTAQFDQSGVLSRVALDELLDAGTLHLDHHFLAVVEAGAVDLTERHSRHRLVVEALEPRADAEPSPRSATAFSHCRQSRRSEHCLGAPLGMRVVPLILIPYLGTV